MEWKQEQPDWYIATCADLMLDVELMETGGDPEPWLWTANLNRAESEGAIEFQSGWAASGDAAKLAAESFVREWVAAQAAALGDGWIPVGERLPERGVAVLAVYVSPIRSDRRIDVMWLGYNGWHAGGAESVTVTHWRPFPPLPVAEVEE